MSETTKHIALNLKDVNVHRHSPKGSRGGPAYFMSLSLENVKCFKENQTLDFSDRDGRPAQWTVILGETGVGKTTVLQSLAALQPAQLVQRELKRDFYLPIPANNYEALQFITSLMFKDAVPGATRVMGSVYCGERLSQPTGKGRLISQYGMEKSDGGIHLSVTGTVADLSKLRNLVVYGYGASRRMGETSLSQSNGADPSASLFSDAIELLNAEEWLLQADYAASKSSRGQPRAQKRRDFIIELLIRLLPDTSAIRFVQPTTTKLPSVQFRTPYGWVNVNQLSLGYRTSIAWMVDLAHRMFKRYPSSKDPLAEPAIVLVDELDLHLHPGWQRSMMDHLSQVFVNTQFIVTAHSPLVVQGAPNANVILLKRSGNQTVVENDISSVQGWRVDQILTSDLFGLPSARASEFDSVLQERRKLLSQPRLTEAEESRIEEIERQLDVLPIGDVADDMHAIDLIRRIAQVEQRREIDR
jgi:predicted ATPase